MSIRLLRCFCSKLYNLGSGNTFFAGSHNTDVVTENILRQKKKKSLVFKMPFKFIRVASSSRCQGEHTYLFLSHRANLR